jgi:hypothetical protein
MPASNPRIAVRTLYPGETSTSGASRGADPQRGPGNMTAPWIERETARALADGAASVWVEFAGSRYAPAEFAAYLRGETESCECGHALSEHDEYDMARNVWPPCACHHYQGA